MDSSLSVTSDGTILSPIGSKNESVVIDAVGDLASFLFHDAVQIIHAACGLSLFPNRMLTFIGRFS